MNKDTYCPMPFVTLAVNPNNWLTRCMMSNSDMGPIERDAWSNDKFTALRTDMLAGKWDEDGCHSCWYKEQNGQTSRRNKWVDSELKYMGATNVYENNLSVKRNTIKHLYMSVSSFHLAGKKLILFLKVKKYVILQLYLKIKSFGYL